MTDDITLLLDERQDVLDQGVVRTIVSCVELDGKLTSEQIESYVGSAISGITYPGGKLHLADMDYHKKVATIRALSSLDFTAKVWVSYSILTNQSQAKTDTMTLVLKSLLKKHSKKNALFIVEQAEEYKAIIKDRFLTGSAYVSLLPDATCYIMAQKLSVRSMSIDTPEGKTYKDGVLELIQLFHEHIRLQVFASKGAITELARASRL